MRPADDDLIAGGGRSKPPEVAAGELRKPSSFKAKLVLIAERVIMVAAGMAVGSILAQIIGVLTGLLPFC